jgi:lysozyme family protein
MLFPPITMHADDNQFVLCLPPIIIAEGYPGDGDDPHDPGGRTHAGIIQREYDIYRRSIGKPSRDVYLASWNEVCDIYYRSYWLPWCPQVWPGVNQMLFDQSVNEGPVQGARNLQRALNSYHDPGMTASILRTLHLRAGTLVVDGHIGPNTLEVLGALKDRRDFLKAYFDWDMSFYRQISGWIYYGKGWTARATAIYNAALLVYDSHTVGSTVKPRR